LRKVTTSSNGWIAQRLIIGDPTRKIEGDFFSACRQFTRFPGQMSMSMTHQLVSQSYASPATLAAQSVVLRTECPISNENGTSFQGFREQLKIQINDLFIITRHVLSRD
jgi:hypothetical protein